MTTALVSLLTGRPLAGGPRHDRRGQLSPGACCPSAASRRRCWPRTAPGLRTVILPRRNEKSLLEDVPEPVREVMTFKLADSVDQVLDWALEPVPAERTSLGEHAAIY